LKNVPFNPSDLRILVVDDVVSNRNLLGEILEAAGYNVSLAPSAEIALNLARDDRPDLILLDILMPNGMDGFQACQKLKADPRTGDIPVMFITSFKDDTESRITGFRVGGVDYITRPFEKEEVLVRVKTHLKTSCLTQTLLKQTEALQQEIARRQKVENARKKADDHLSLISQKEMELWGISGFVGKSPTIQKILEDIRRLRKAKKTAILIFGESGTGKELIARAIHFGGLHAKGPFIPVNCSAVPAELAESLFFGHVRGAFTSANTSRKGYFELADKGTLFLDEIGDMPLTLQAKLLRVLEDGKVLPLGENQERQVNVRIIAATNQDLQAKMENNAFRSDLYYRLNQYTVKAPPLRERPEDIPLLAEHFLMLFAEEMRIKQPVLSEEALAVLTVYSYPGNVRELKNIIESALIKNENGVIRREHLCFLTTTRLSTTKPDEKQAQIERILAYIKQHGSITNESCRRLLGISCRRASYLLNAMYQQGLLERKGTGR